MGLNPSTWEAKEGEFLNSRPTWSTEPVPEEPELHKETLCEKNQRGKRKRKEQDIYEGQS